MMFAVHTWFLSLWTAGGLLAPATSTAPVVHASPEARPNQLTTEEKRAGFRLLFDGQTLDGWEHNGKPGSFTVKDGVIVGDRTGKSQLAYWLSTDREYGDFELRLQVKLGTDGNSGIFIRAPRQGRASRVGMEVQLLDDGSRTGQPGIGDTGAIYQVAAPKAYVSRPAGQWNDLRILCDGPRVQVTLNGQIINDVLMTDLPALKNRPRQGFIGLSAHTKPVQFRSIRLREIKPAQTQPSATRPAGS
jgi:hypothetical protein